MKRAAVLPGLVLALMPLKSLAYSIYTDGSSFACQWRIHNEGPADDLLHLSGITRSGVLDLIGFIVTAGATVELCYASNVCTGAPQQLLYGAASIKAKTMGPEHHVIFYGDITVDGVQAKLSVDYDDDMSGLIDFPDGAPIDDIVLSPAPQCSFSDPVP